MLSDKFTLLSRMCIILNCWIANFSIVLSEIAKTILSAEIVSVAFAFS